MQPCVRVCDEGPQEIKESFLSDDNSGRRVSGAFCGSELGGAAGGADGGGGGGRRSPLN